MAKAGRPRLLSKTQERNLVIVYWGGLYPVKSIALAFDVSRQTVYDCVKRNPHLRPKHATRRSRARTS